MRKNEGFTCKNCGREVSYLAFGTRNRNHCPFCLFSLHVDDEPGDRKSDCGGLMEPIGKIYKPDGEEVLVHKCLNCATVRKNRIAGDDLHEVLAALPTLEYF